MNRCQGFNFQFPSRKASAKLKIEALAPAHNSMCCGTFGDRVNSLDTARGTDPLNSRRSLEVFRSLPLQGGTASGGIQEKIGLAVAWVGGNG